MRPWSTYGPGTARIRRTSVASGPTHTILALYNRIIGDAAVLKLRGQLKEDKVDFLIPKKLDAVVFQDEGIWVGVFLEHYLVTQANTKAALLEELRRLVTAHIVISLENGQRPFKDLPRAPQRYWNLLPEGKRPDVTVLYRIPSEVTQASGESELLFHEIEKIA